MMCVPGAEGSEARKPPSGRRGLAGIRAERCWSDLEWDRTRGQTRNPCTEFALLKRCLPKERPPAAVNAYKTSLLARTKPGPQREKP